MAGGAGDLPEAGRPEPHRRPQDQQRPRPGHDRPPDGQDPRDRRDRRRPARRRDGHRLRPLRPGMHRLHGRGGHPPPEAQRLQHEDDGRAASSRSPPGSRTLRDATNEAMRDWMGSSKQTHYTIGSVVGPHPFPMIVRDFQSVIGRETRAQCLDRLGRLPDAVVAWRPPRSSPRASFSIVCAMPWASAVCDSAARSTWPRAASQSDFCSDCENSSRCVESSNRARGDLVVDRLGLGAAGRGRRGGRCRRGRGRRPAFLGPRAGVVLGRGLQLGQRQAAQRGLGGLGGRRFRHGR